MSELNTPTEHDLDQAVDHTADSVNASVERARSAAHAYVGRGSQAVRNNAARLKDNWGMVADRTANYVHEQPLKSILIAAAAGAGIAMLASLLSQHRDRH